VKLIGRLAKLRTAAIGVKPKKRVRAERKKGAGRQPQETGWPTHRSAWSARQRSAGKSVSANRTIAGHMFLWRVNTAASYTVRFYGRSRAKVLHEARATDRREPAPAADSLLASSQACLRKAARRMRASSCRLLLGDSLPKRCFITEEMIGELPIDMELTNEERRRVSDQQYRVVRRLLRAVIIASRLDG
jgi:hypothetical protein